MTTSIESIEEKASYGLGIQLGQQAQNAFAEVSLQALLQGVTDVFEGSGLRIKGEDINAALMEIQRRIESQAEQQSVAGEKFLEQNKVRDGVFVTASGLQYEVISSGDGERPAATSRVRTHYRGTLIDGKEFDSSYARGEPTEFPVNGVIAGWQEALQLMQVGDKWKLFIPHQLAYGKQGAGADIGPYQALVFELELLAIVD